MADGVTFRNPTRSSSTRPSRSAPTRSSIRSSRIEGTTKIGRGCVIEPGVHLINVTVGDNVHVKSGTVAEDAMIEDERSVGPYAHLRPGTQLGRHVKVGNFVETKKAVFGEGAKASHLSYIGDAEVGADVNIGAGTITCNYDGVNKHKTVIEDGVFIGSDTQLVAPVRVGKGAYVGAGSTITKDVPPTRSRSAARRRRIVEGWATKRREESKKKRVTRRSRGGTALAGATFVGIARRIDRRRSTRIRPKSITTRKFLRKFSPTMPAAFSSSADVYIGRVWNVPAHVDADLHVLHLRAVLLRAAEALQHRAVDLRREDAGSAGPRGASSLRNVTSEPVSRMNMNQPRRLIVPRTRGRKPR